MTNPATAENIACVIGITLCILFFTQCKAKFDHESSVTQRLILEQQHEIKMLEMKGEDQSPNEESEER